MAAVAAMAPATASAMDEGSVAKRLWFSSRKDALFAAYTPFVLCLAAGSLEVETFRGYIAQDACFLKAFAKAYEMAEEHADDDEAKVALCQLRRAVLDELKMHDSVLKEWGADPAKEITPIPATVKYTEFLLATASGKIQGGKGPVKIVTPFEKTKIASYTVGALTPCMRLYAFLGREIRLLVGQDGIIDHPYRKWIDNYSSDNFEKDAQDIEELLDKLSVTLTGEELEIIEKLYGQAMRLEIEFFEAHPIVTPVVVPFVKTDNPPTHFVIFSDFDLTCTSLDSSAILAEIAILTAQKAIQTGLDNLATQKSPSDVRSSWNVLSKRYAEEYEQCIESILSSDEAKSFDYDALYESLEKLSDFEKQANARVIDSELLKGLKFDDIKKTGERLNLQDGCKDFFQKVVQRKQKLSADLHILSYCWCADLIRSAFSSVGVLNELSIHSNEFNYEESISTGSIIRKIESPIDKVNTFKDILSNLDNKKHLSVYIGDSVGDLLCLLQADVGIVMGSSESLRRVGKQFGVSFVPLYNGLVNKQRQLQQDESSIWKGLSGVLYTVSSWLEVEAFLLGA